MRLPSSATEYIAMASTESLLRIHENEVAAQIPLPLHISQLIFQHLRSDESYLPAQRDELATAWTSGAVASSASREATLQRKGARWVSDAVDKLKILHEKIAIAHRENDVGRLTEMHDRITASVFSADLSCFDPSDPHAYCSPL